MSSLDDHCIITKYELTEKEKQLKKAFFNPSKKSEGMKKRKEENLKNLSGENNNLIPNNQKSVAVNDDILNKFIKDNIDPVVNNNLKYLNGNSNGAQTPFLPLNIVYNQNKILERNVDILQETQRSLKDFFIYNLKNSYNNHSKKGQRSHVKSDSFEDKKFLMDLVKPLYQNIESIKTQINNLANTNKKENFEPVDNRNDVYSMQKNLKNSTSKVEKSLNLIEQHTNQTKKDNELIKMMEEIKGSITNVHKEMSKLETDVSENFKKMYEETQKKNLLQMLSNSSTNKNLNSNAKNNFSVFNNLNNNKNCDLLKNSVGEDDSIDYAEFKKSLCDINLRTQEIKNDYEISKSKINLIHKFEKAEKIDFSYDIDFKDPFSFNSFTTNDDSLLAKEKKEKSKSVKKNFLTKNKNHISNLSKNRTKNNVNRKGSNNHQEADDNYDTTDHEIFNKNNVKKNNVFLDNLNKSIDSKTNVKQKIEKNDLQEMSSKKKAIGNQSTNYTINSPTGMQNNTNSLIKSNNNKINIISEETSGDNESEEKNKNKFLENAKSEFEKKNNSENVGKKGLKDLLKEKTVLNETTTKQKLLKDLVTKVLIEKIIVDKNKKASGKGSFNGAPATNEELYFFLREKEFSGKYGTGKYLDLDIDEKNAREVTEKVVKEKIKTLLNKKKLRNLLNGSKENKNIKESKSEPELAENLDILKNLENKLFEKLNNENMNRDNFLSEKFKIILERLSDMEKSMGGNLTNANRKSNLFKNLANENNDKLSDSQYIEVDKTDRKNKNYDDMIEQITEKIKSNMHITINLNEGKVNNNTNLSKKLDLQSESLNIISEKPNKIAENNNSKPEHELAYTHPFADRNKILQMLDINNLNTENLMKNIPLPHTINFQEYDVSSESCFSESKRTEINSDINRMNNENNNKNYYTTTNPNLLYYTNIDNKIPNFQNTGNRFKEDQMSYINYNKLSSPNNVINYDSNSNVNLNNKNDHFSNEKHLLEANLLAAEIKRLNAYHNLPKISSRDESLSEGQVVTMSGLHNESEFESIYAQSHTNIDNQELDELNRKIIQNKKKLEALNQRDINLIDLKNINKDLEKTLEKYNNKNININYENIRDNNEYEEPESQRYGLSNSNLIEDDQTDKKMQIGELNEQKDIIANPNFNRVNNDLNNQYEQESHNKNIDSSQKMEEKIKFLKSKNLYDSEEQETFQKTFQNVLKKNNIINNNNYNSNNNSQGSNFQNLLSNFSNNVNLSGSLASSGKLRLGSARHNFLSSNNNHNMNQNINNNQVYVSFGGNILNSNHNNIPISNRSNQILQQQAPQISNSQVNSNYVNPFSSPIYSSNQPSNVSSNVNSGRLVNDSMNTSNYTNYENSNNNYGVNPNLDKYYYGYNNTISENYSESVDSAMERRNYINNNDKLYKTDESSLDIQN